MASSAPATRAPTATSTPLLQNSTPCCLCIDQAPAESRANQDTQQKKNCLSQKNSRDTTNRDRPESGAVNRAPLLFCSLASRLTCDVAQNNQSRPATANWRRFSPASAHSAKRNGRAPESTSRPSAVDFALRSRSARAVTDRRARVRVARRPTLMVSLTIDETRIEPSGLALDFESFSFSKYCAKSAGRHDASARQIHATNQTRHSR